MARETKVGLLVGLAFIVCFAVILANQGKEKSIANQLPYCLLVDKGPGAVEVAVEEPEATGEENWSTLTTTYAPLAIQEESVVSVSPDYRPGTRPHATSPSETDSPGSALDKPRRIFSYPGTDLSRRLDTANHLTTEADEDKSGASLADHSDPKRVPLYSRSKGKDELDRLSEFYRQAKGNASDKEISESNLPAMYPQTSEPKALPKQSTIKAAPRYEVKSGDSLSKIARKCYGSEKREVLQAIYQANTSVMPDINTLQVGDVLTLPLIDGHQDPLGDRTSKATRTRSTVQNNFLADFRWYQVKNKDRYSSIAREQLGDESRWREIFELNKDKFPNPDRIRVGVRIKIPLR